MGCKICKPKMMDCLTCKKNTEPQESFCFDKGECSVPFAMVRNGELIGWANNDDNV